jgi:hypothetical protein
MGYVKIELILLAVLLDPRVEAAEDTVVMVQQRVSRKDARTKIEKRVGDPAPVDSQIRLPP